MQTRVLSSTTMIGDKVRNNEGDELGTVEEIVVDLDEGEVAYVVLAAGGFLGMGEKFFALPWDAVTVDTDAHEFLVPIAKETLENAPGFDKDNWPDFADREYSALIYRHYGFEPRW